MTEIHETDIPLDLDIASGRMISESASELTVRHFAPFISDEPPERGGEDRAPAPLEYVMAALCA